MESVKTVIASVSNARRALNVLVEPIQNDDADSVLSRTSRVKTHASQVRQVTTIQDEGLLDRFPVHTDTIRNCPGNNDVVQHLLVFSLANADKPIRLPAQSERIKIYEDKRVANPHLLEHTRLNEVKAEERNVHTDIIKMHLDSHPADEQVQVMSYLNEDRNHKRLVG